MTPKELAAFFRNKLSQEWFSGVGMRKELNQAADMLEEMESAGNNLVMSGVWQKPKAIKRWNKATKAMEDKYHDQTE